MTEVKRGKLFAAVYEGNEKEALSYLTEDGWMEGIDPEETDEEGFSVLHEAVRNNLLEVVGALITFGADVDAQTVEGHTPLSVASYDGLADMITLLIDYDANPNVQDNYGNTALHHAAHKNSIDSLRAILEAEWCIPDLKNSEGQTPLHVAVYWQNEELVNCLLEFGADINAKDAGGLTPLWFLEGFRHSTDEFCDFLKGKGATA